MTTGELNCCLELFIMYVKCIEIDFSDTNGVLFGLRNENLNV